MVFNGNSGDTVTSLHQGPVFLFAVRFINKYTDADSTGQPREGPVKSTAAQPNSHPMLCIFHIVSSRIPPATT
jgi:hypothetical protein